MPTSNDHPVAPQAPEAGDTSADAAKLMARLALQLAQLHRTLAAQPWQAPALKEISRMLECASRAAFTDKEVWRSLWRENTTCHLPSCRLRPGGLTRAIRLLDRAEARLSQLSGD